MTRKKNIGLNNEIGLILKEQNNYFHEINQFIFKDLLGLY